MSEHTTTVPPAVEAFVAQVRSRLADLSEDDRDDLLGGLEADLADQLADGVTDLGDPATYADELRAAAGLPEARRSRGRIPSPRPRLPRAEDVGRRLDGARLRFFARLERHPAGPRTWEVVATLRPAWWVLRAWAAVTLLDSSTGPWERVSVLPTLGVPGLGPAVLVAAIVLSTLIGLGRVWPGSGPQRAPAARVLVLAANLAAVGVLVSVSTGGSAYLSSAQSPWQDEGRFYGHSGSYVPRDGLRLDGSPVENVFAYDAAGNPLSGVQLYRGNGDPLTVSAEQSTSGRGKARTVRCGWLNGSARLFHVFPLAERTQRRGTCLDDDPTGAPVTAVPAPFAQVPPVTSPVTALESPPVEPPAVDSPPVESPVDPPPRSARP